MGSGGLVAESFAQLLEQLWTLPTQVVNPTNFKRTFEAMTSNSPDWSSTIVRSSLFVVLSAIDV